MSLGITKNQAYKIGKTAGYIALSAVISYLITLTTDDPQLFGPLTGLVNLALVAVKALVTEDK